MTHVIKEHISNIAEIEKKLFYTLLAVVIILSTMYAVLLKQAIVNVVERESIEQSISLTRSELGDLEAHYITAKSAVDLETAEHLGLATISKAQYITRPALGSRISLGNEI